MDIPVHAPPDPDFETRVRENFDRQAMMATLGVDITGIGPGWIELEFDHDARFTQQDGFVHAGAVATVLDSACGYAAFTLMPSDATVLTVEYKINLLKPALSGRYRAKAVVVRSGRTLTICRGEFSAVGSPDPFAIMTGTLIALA